MLTTALKRARLMAMLPYTADHVRGLMSPQARAMAGGPPPPKPERPPFRPAGELRPAGAPFPRRDAPPPAQAPAPTPPPLPSEPPSRQKRGAARPFPRTYGKPNTAISQTTI